MMREREIMKDVPGWRAGENVYHGHRYSIHLRPRLIVDTFSPNIF